MAKPIPAAVELDRLPPPVYPFAKMFTSFLHGLPADAVLTIQDDKGIPVELVGMVAGEFNDQDHLMINKYPPETSVKLSQSWTQIVECEGGGRVVDLLGVRRASVVFIGDNHDD